MTLDDIKKERQYYQILKAVSFIFAGIDLGMSGNLLIQIIKFIEEQKIEPDIMVWKVLYCLCFSVVGGIQVKDYFKAYNKLEELKGNTRKLGKK